MRGEILGLERRRRWSDDEKLAIVNSIGVGGATVTQVAQRHDLERQQIYAWRRDLKNKGLLAQSAEALFLPVEFLETGLCEAPKAYGSDPEQDDRVEVVLRNGRSLRIGAGMSVTTLARLIKTVEAA